MFRKVTGLATPYSLEKRILSILPSVLITILVAMATYNSKSSAEKEGLLRLTVGGCCPSWWERPGGRGVRPLVMLCTQSGGREKWMLVLRSPNPFYSVWDPACGVEPSTFRVGSPTSSTQGGTSLSGVPRGLPCVWLLVLWNWQDVLSHASHIYPTLLIMC